MLEGAAHDMKHTWTREAFFAKAEHAHFQPQKLPTSVRANMKGQGIQLQDYLEEVSKGMHPKPFAFNNPVNKSLWAALEADITWPTALSVPALQSNLSGFSSLFVGPQGSGISMHHHKGAWNALFFGKKLWVLTPPAVSTFSRFKFAAAAFEEEWLEEAAARARGETALNARRYCVQQEGDVLFVPAGWGHSTVNLQVT